MSVIAETAHAKLNLFLHITGKRADGFHLLESLVVFTVFGDLLTFSPSDTVSLSIAGEFSAALQQDKNNNLVLRAAQALQAAAHCHKGAAIHVEKNIPIAAGLGGGSGAKQSRAVSF